MILLKGRQTRSAPFECGNFLRENKTSEPNFQAVAINYDKLRHFCSTFSSGNGSHQFAMSEYPSLFFKVDKEKDISPFHCPHTCHEIQNTQLSPSHDVRVHVFAIRKEKKKEDALRLASCVRIMLSIIKKLPVMRSDREVKQLAHQLEFFSTLLPVPDQNISKVEFYCGLAQRATLEKLPGEGYAISGKNGLHLILQGKVEKRSLEDDKKFVITSTILNPGDSFGNIIKPTGDGGQITWPTYPYYCTKTACCLLNISSADYHRVVQICKKSFFEERHGLVNHCPLFSGVSSLVTSQLTKRINWERIPAGTTVVQEGEPIKELMFIKEGQCSAIAKVPTRTRTMKLKVGTLGPRDCIGELLIWNGTEVHPYTVVSQTELTAGVIKSSAFEPNEIRKHISLHGRPSLPLLSEEQLRSRHARHLMSAQWQRVKDHIVGEVVTERGIEFDTKKWKHTFSS